MTTSGARFLHADRLPAAVLTYIASDPSDTIADIANDLPGRTVREVYLAVTSLVRRGFMVWNEEGEQYTVTPLGWQSIKEMLNR